MVRCAAVKKKGTTNQCPNKTIFGHSLCGTHAKAKHVEIWKDVREKDGRVVKCQAIARGWLVRSHLRLAGPGVLKRKDLANDEELVTCEESTRQYPFDYFAFIEGDKTWWFDFGSLWVWSLKSAEPSNPYTKVPLSTETRKRLREMWAMRGRRKLPIPAEPVVPQERINTRWNMLCQTFADNGFTDVTLSQLTRLNKGSHIVMWSFIRDDIPSARVYANYMLEPRMTNRNTATYIINSVRLLMRIVTIKKESYVDIFNVMSAIYRC